MPNNPDLAALSEAATQGEWFYRPLEHEACGLIRGEEDDRWGWVSRPIIAQFRGRQDEEELNEHRRAGTDPWKADPLFVTALVNEYRAGRLVQIDEGMSEKVALALCQNALGPKQCACAEKGVFNCADAYPGYQADAAIAAMMGGA